MVNLKIHRFSRTIVWGTQTPHTKTQNSEMKIFNVLAISLIVSAVCADAFILSRIHNAASAVSKEVNNIMVRVNVARIAGLPSMLRMSATSRVRPSR